MEEAPLGALPVGQEHHGHRDTVTKFEFDQFSGYLSYTQMAVNNKETSPEPGRRWGAPPAAPTSSERTAG